MTRRALEDWSESSLKKINHSFRSSKPENEPIRHLSEQLTLLATVEPETPVEPVSRSWNTTVILAELRHDMSSYWFRRQFRFDH